MFFRSELEDEREINHHGKARTVGGDDTSEDRPAVGFDKNLVSVLEGVQDKALREYYSKVKLTKKKEKILQRCINFSRRVKPVVAVIFVIVYWVSGLKNYQRIE